MPPHLDSAGPPPVHCPDQADARQHMEAAQGSCDTVHGVLEQSRVGVGQWLQRVVEALASATLLDLRVPHADALRAPVAAHDLDPQSAHLVVEQARYGSLEAAGLYVGITLQSAAGVWHGLAGVYLPLCRSCSESLSIRGVRGALAQIPMPQGTEALSLDALPAGLRPRVGWLEDRMVGAYRLPGQLARPWQPLAFASPRFASEAQALVHTGPRLTDESNLIYLSNPIDVRKLAPSLVAAPETRDHAISSRFGDARTLRRIAGEGQGAPIPPQVVALRGVRSRLPAGWGVLRICGSDEPCQTIVTRAATATLRAKQKSGELPQDARVELWRAPRLSPQGAIDGSALVRLAERLRDPSVRA